MNSFLVIGLGEFGRSVAIELTNKGHEVMVIDKDEKKIDEFEGVVTYTKMVDVQDEEGLAKIGVSDFDIVIVAIASNIEVSILTTLMLRELNAKKIVCKAKNQLHKKALKLMGANEIIRPELDMGKNLAHLLTQKNIVDSIPLPNHKTIIKINTPKAWIGKNIFNKMKKYEAKLISSYFKDTLIDITEIDNQIVQKDYIFILLVDDYMLAKLQVLEMN